MSAKQEREPRATSAVRKGRTDHRRAWVLSIATDLEDRIRLLTEERRAAYRRVKVIRSDGHLIPGSLNEELADNQAALERALTRYRELPDTAGR